VENQGAHAFLLRFALALHSCGTPAHRLEAAVRRLSQALGLPAEVLATPTSLTVGLDQRVRIFRVQPGEIHLARLVGVDAVGSQVAAGQLDLQEAGSRLAALEGRTPALHWQLLASAAASAGAAGLLGGGWWDVAAAGLLGLLIGQLLTSLGRSERLGRLAPLLAALLASSAAGALGSLLPLSVPLLTVSGVICLVPGLTLTVGVSEVAERHWAAGSARLTGAVGDFLLLGVGVALGARLVADLAPLGQPQPALPTWAQLVALLVAPLAFALLFGARRQDAPVIALTSWLAFYGARLGAELAGPELGAGLGAALVGVAGNLQARWRRVPAAVAIFPGILILVPGIVGFRGVEAMLHDQVLDGVDTAFSALLVAASLVTGLLAAQAAVPSRREL